MKSTNSHKIKNRDRDLWYKRMSEKTSSNPEDERVVGLMEYFELNDEFGSTNFDTLE